MPEVDIFLVFVVIIYLFVIVGALGLYAYRYKRVPPNMVMVVYGRRQPGGKGQNLRIITGGGKFIIPLLEDCSFLSIGTMEDKLSMENVRLNSKERIFLKVMVISRISPLPEKLVTAAETILGKEQSEIKEMVSRTVEGWTRDLAFKQTRKGIEEDRAAFMTAVTKKAQKDLDNLGIEIRSIVLLDVAENRFEVADVKALQWEIRELSKDLESAQRRLDSLLKKKG